MSLSNYKLRSLKEKLNKETIEEIKDKAKPEDLKEKVAKKKNKTNE